MALNLLDRLLIVAVVMAFVATIACTMTVYIWATEATDKDDVQRVLYPAIPGLELGEIPPAEWMAKELIQGMWRGMPNARLKSLFDTVEYGASNYPTLTDANLIYTCPEETRTYVSGDLVNFGQLPSAPSPQNYFICIERFGWLLPIFDTYQTAFMDPGDKLYLFADPGLYYLVRLVEMDITPATPRTYIYQNAGPFSYTPPKGHIAIDYTSPDPYFPTVVYAHSNLAVPAGSRFGMRYNGVPLLDEAIQNAPAYRPRIEDMRCFVNVQEGDTLEFTWPAALDGFLSLGFTVLEIAV